MVCRSHSWHSRAEGIQRDVHASFADQWRPTKVLFVLAILSLECRIAALFMMLAWLFLTLFIMMAAIILTPFMACLVSELARRHLWIELSFTFVIFARFPLTILLNLGTSLYPRVVRIIHIWILYYLILHAIGIIDQGQVASITGAFKACWVVLGHWGLSSALMTWFKMLLDLLAIKWRFTKDFYVHLPLLYFN